MTLKSDERIRASYREFKQSGTPCPQCKQPSPDYSVSVCPHCGYCYDEARKGGTEAQPIKSEAIKSKTVWIVRFFASFSIDSIWSSEEGATKRMEELQDSTGATWFITEWKVDTVAD